jgi:GLPGLI family protein
MMNFRYTLSTFLLIIALNTVSAQNVRFPTEGVIEYTKTVNMHALIKRNISSMNNSFYQQAFEAYKKSQPQFKALKSTMKFGADKTLFTPLATKETASGGFFGNEPAANQNNTVYTDLSTGVTTSQKLVYEDTFLVKDSTRKITWKITDEMREIAGYNCRRANAIMLDSIYVVAFYTDQIPVSGGPESFSGLPGMILGVALPHENMTWFATKVTDAAVPANTLVAPAKGKAMDLKGFNTYLTDALKSWGDYAKPALKAFML